MTKHWSQDVFETIGYMGAVTENMLMQSKRAANRVESEIQKFATMSTEINRDFKIDHEVRIGYLGVRTDEEEKLPLGGFATIMVTSLYKNGGMTVTLGLEVHGSEALGAKVDEGYQEEIFKWSHLEKQNLLLAYEAIRHQVCIEEKVEAAIKHAVWCVMPEDLEEQHEKLFGTPLDHSDVSLSLTDAPFKMTFL